MLISVKRAARRRLGSAAPAHREPLRHAGAALPPTISVSARGEGSRLFGRDDASTVAHSNSCGFLFDLAGDDEALDLVGALCSRWGEAHRHEQRSMRYSARLSRYRHVICSALETCFIAMSV